MNHFNDFNGLTDNVAVSVIVPAYNCEESIGNLIESLKGQSFSSFQVIIVDDGSKDRTGSVVNELTFQDNRFIFISKQNEGPALARNAGMQQAVGEYITFADSDDILDRDFIKRMYEEAIINTSDMVICGYNLKMISIKGEIKNRIITFSSKQGNNKKEVCSLYTELLVNNLAFSVWNKLFKRSIIKNNNLTFNDYSIAEDRIFVLDFILHCNQMSFIEDSLYYYTLSTNGNQTRKYNRDRFEAMKRYCINLSDYYNKMEYNEGIKIVKEVLIKAILSSLVAYYDKSCKMNAKEKSVCFKETLNDTFVHSMLCNNVNVGKISSIISIVFRSKIIWINKLLSKGVYFVLVNFPHIVDKNK